MTTIPENIVKILPVEYKIHFKLIALTNPYLFNISASFTASSKRKTTHSNLFLPKEYTGDPYGSVFNYNTEAQVLAYLETGWGIADVEELQLSFLYGPEDDQ